MTLYALGCREGTPHVHRQGNFGKPDIKTAWKLGHTRGGIAWETRARSEEAAEAKPIEAGKNFAW